METIALISALLIKHFLVDFILQTPYEYKNKGTYGHAGGLYHAIKHGILTFAVLGAFSWSSLPFDMILFLCFAEIFAHYHIDWFKMNMNSYYEWKADTSDYFWWLLGFDQLLHHACYIVIAIVAL